MGLSAREYRNTLEWKQQYYEMEADPILFARIIAPKMCDIPSPDFHYELANLYLDDAMKQVNVIAPRGHAKSTIVAGVFVLHHLVFGKGVDEKVVVLCSKTQGEAKKRLGTIKKLIHEPRFQYMFGHIIGNEDSALRWNDSEVKLADGSLITCVGTGQQVRGLKEGYTRPSFVVLDDPEDENNTRTAEAMEKNYDWVINGLTEAVDKRNGKIWVIGTPLHERCMVFRLKDRIDWESRHYSAEADPENEQPLWEDLYTWDDLMTKREAAKADNKLSSYYQEMLCQVQPDEKRLFRKEYLRYYDGDIEWQAGEAILKYRELDKRGNPITDMKRVPVNIFMGIDPAVSTSESADWFVIFPMAVDPDNNRFVLPYVRAKMPPSKSIEEIIRQYKKWNPKVTSIETSGQQETFRDILRNRDDVYIPGLSRKHNPKDKKEKRHLDTLEPWFSDRKVFLRRSQDTLLNELYMHPKGKTDDILDGMYYANVHAYPPKRQTKSDRYRKKAKQIDAEDAWLLA